MGCGTCEFPFRNELAMFLTEESPKLHSSDSRVFQAEFWRNLVIPWNPELDFQLNKQFGPRTT